LELNDGQKRKYHTFLYVLRVEYYGLYWLQVIHFKVTLLDQLLAIRGKHLFFLRE
jgi:hypothetical protein